jgi:hypothetical protein
VERAIRQLVHLKDATLFGKLLKLLAGRVGRFEVGLWPRRKATCSG